MTLPPAVTWISLLPRDCSYICHSGPEWLKEALAAHGGEGLRRVLVSCQQGAAQLPDLESYHGFVAINVRGLAEASLQQQGFPYVRRLAILPRLGQPRWFIPLENAAVSAASFELYKPVRWMPRLKHWGARAIARWGSHCWYQDHMWIALREPPPLESLLRSLFGGNSFPGVSLAFSSGNVLTVRNRKPVLAVLDPSGRTLGFGKLSISPLSRRRVQHEATILPLLAARGRNVMAPRLLFSGEVEGAWLTVTSPLAGRAAGRHLSTAHHQFLSTLCGAELKPVGHTALVRTLCTAAASLAEPRPWNLLHRVLPLLERVALPTTLAHRDFAPWNLRQHRGTIAAFDWEYAEPEAPPLLDVFHHELAVAYFLDRCTPEQGCQRLLRLSPAAHVGVSLEHTRALQVLYLIDHLMGMQQEGYDRDYPKFVWWTQVLNRLASTLPLSNALPDGRDRGQEPKAMHANGASSSKPGRGLGVLR